MAAPIGTDEPPGGRDKQPASGRGIRHRIRRVASDAERTEPLAAPASREPKPLGSVPPDDLLDPTDAPAIARLFVRTIWHARDNVPTLVYWRDRWWRWEECRWHEMPDALLLAAIHQWLDRKFIAERADTKDKKAAFVAAPFKPKRRDVDEVAFAVRAELLLDPGVSPPCWLSSPSGSGPITAFPRQVN